MHVERLSDHCFGDSALSTGVPLFSTDIRAYDAPALPVGCPSAFPRRVIFEFPILSLPFTEATATAEELSLAARNLEPHLPIHENDFVAAGRTVHPSGAIVTRPPFCASILSPARIRTEVNREDSVFLQLKRRPAIGACRFNSMLCRRRIRRAQKTRAAGHRTKSPSFCFLLGKVWLERESRSTTDAYSRYSF